MGKRLSYDMKLIEGNKDRQNTFLKRKRGFLKKAIEYCNLCGLQMHIIILDQNK